MEMKWSIATEAVLLLASFACAVTQNDTGNFGGSHTNEELFKALRSGDSQEIRQRLEAFPSTNNYNVFSRSNWSLLHETAYDGLADVIAKLAQTGVVDLTPINDEGDTPLHIAVRRGHMEAVTALVAVANGHGNLASLLETENPKTGNTPIFEAAQPTANNTKAIAGLKCAANLIHAGASLGHENADGWLPIHYAMLNDRLDFVKMALIKNTTLAKQRAGLKNNGKTLSHLAAETNSLKFLEDMGDWFYPAVLDSHGQTPACYAVAMGHFRFAKAMVDMSHADYPLKDYLVTPDPICRYNIKHYPHLSGSPLHVAAMNRHHRIVALLVDNGADTKARDTSNGTVFHGMAMVTDAEQVQALDLAEYHDDELEDEPMSVQVHFRITPVLTRIPDRHRDHETINNFLGSDIPMLESTDANGRTPFLSSIFFGAEEFSKLLLIDFEVSASSVDHRGYSALHLANDAMQFHELFLLEENAFPSGIDTRSFPGSDDVPGLMTPLMVAVAENKPIELIGMMYLRKADVSLTNDHNQSLAHLAVLANFKELIENKNDLLDFEAKDKRGISPVHLAVENGNLDVLRSIVSAMANTSKLQSVLEQTTPLSMSMSNSLHLAVIFEHLEIVDYLIDVHPGLIERKDALGRTAAHLAVACENPKILRSMLDKLEDPSVVTLMWDNYGRTPLMHAVGQGKVVLAELLLTKYHSSCELIDGESTALDLARKLSNWRMAKALASTGMCGSDPKMQCELPFRDGSYALGKVASPGTPILPPDALVSLGSSVSVPGECNRSHISNTCKFPGRWSKPSIEWEAAIGHEMRNCGTVNGSAWDWHDTANYLETVESRDGASDDVFPLIVAVVVPIIDLVVVVLVIICCCLCFSARRASSPVAHIEIQKHPKPTSPSPCSDDRFPADIESFLYVYRISVSDVSTSEEIGVGHFGKVKLGLLRRADNSPIPVAVKFIQNIFEPEFFNQEAKHMLELDHPNVMNAYGWVYNPAASPEQSVALVLPLMDVGDLRKFVLSVGNMVDDFLVLDFAHQIAMGMEYLAKKNIVHRDLAARNCLLNSDRAVKISDFGLSRQSNNRESDYDYLPTYHVQTAQRPLPIRWMAPESIKRQFFSERTDVWSFGVVLWELTSKGVRPYNELRSSEEVVRHICTRMLLPKRFGMSNLIYSLMEKCWRQALSERPRFRELVTTISLLLTDTDAPFRRALKALTDSNKVLNPQPPKTPTPPTSFVPL